MKKAAKSKKPNSKAPKAKTKSKAKGKTKPARSLKAAAKTKSKVKAKSKPKKLAKPQKKSASKSRGLSVVELFELKNQNAESIPQSPGDWQHKKDLPPQEQHGKDDMRAKNQANVKKSGFGGVRHH